MGKEDLSCLLSLLFHSTFPWVPLSSYWLNVKQDFLSTDHVFSRCRTSCCPPWACSSEAERKGAVAHLTLTGQPQRGDLGSESWRGLEEHRGQQGKRAGEVKKKEGWNGGGENLRLAFDSWKAEGTEIHTHTHTHIKKTIGMSTTTEGLDHVNTCLRVKCTLMSSRGRGVEYFYFIIFFGTRL